MNILKLFNNFITLTHATASYNDDYRLLKRFRNVNKDISTIRSDQKSPIQPETTIFHLPMQYYFRPFV